MRFWVHDVIVRGVFSCRLFHVLLNHGEGKLRTIYRCRKLMKQVANRTNVVKVSVCKHDTADLVLVFE